MPATLEQGGICFNRVQRLVFLLGKLALRRSRILGNKIIHRRDQQDQRDDQRDDSGHIHLEI